MHERCTARAIDRGHTDREREREGPGGPGPKAPGLRDPPSLSLCRCALYLSRARAVQRSCTAGQVTSVKARLLRYYGKNMEMFDSFYLFVNC